MKNKIFELSQYEDSKISNCALGSSVALMCPHCYELYIIKQSGCMTAESRVGIDLLISPMYHIQCAKCSKDATAIPLDPPVAFAVSRLNKEGYITEMSCCGHDDDTVNHAYIKFKKRYKLDSLPQDWRLNGLFLEASTLNHKEALQHLNKWVMDIHKN